MIDYKNELLVTNEIVNVLNKFTKAIVLKDLLTEFSFNENAISKLLISSNEKYYDMFSPGSVIDDDILDYASGFLSKLNNDSKMALYFHVLNLNYDSFKEEFIGSTDDSLNENNLDKEFGRYLAGKIYEPKNTELQNDIVEYLKSLLINFSTEFDFSLIDKYTIESVKNTINDYIYIAK